MRRVLVDPQVEQIEEPTVETVREMESVKNNWECVHRLSYELSFGHVYMVSMLFHS